MIDKLVPDPSVQYYAIPCTIEYVREKEVSEDYLMFTKVLALFGLITFALDTMLRSIFVPLAFSLSTAFCSVRFPLLLAMSTARIFSVLF